MTNLLTILLQPFHRISKALGLKTLERQSISALIPNVLSQFLSLISIPIVIGLFELSGLASLILVLTFSSFGSLYSLGLDKVILRKLCAKGPKRRVEFFILTMLAVANFALICIIFQVAAYLSPNKFGSGGISVNLFTLMCFATFLFTISRTTLWADGNIGTLSLANAINNNVHGIVALFLYFSAISLSLTQFFTVMALVKLVLALVCFGYFLTRIVSLPAKSFIHRQFRLTKLFWLKAFDLSIWGAVYVLADNLERILIALFHPPWSALFISIQSLISKLNFIPMAINVPLFLKNQTFNKSIVHASVSYLSFGLGGLLFLNITKSPIETYLFRNSFVIDPIYHILPFGLAVILNLQNQLFVVALEKRGTLKKLYTFELLIVAMLFFIALYGLNANRSMSLFAIIYISKEALLFLTRVLVLKINLRDLIKYNAMNAILFTLTCLLLTVDNEIPIELSPVVYFFEIILTGICFFYSALALKRIK